MSLVPVPAALQRYVDQDALLVTVDVEAHCYNRSYKDFKRYGDTNNRRICEVGMCMLDTRDIANISDVGDRGFNLAQHFEVHELAIKDAEHNNDRWKCRGSWCPVGKASNFLFGSVTWIWKSNIEREMVKVVKTKLGMTANSNKNRGKGKSMANKGTDLTHRKVVFLYFDCSNDIKWLDEHNVNLPAPFPNSEMIDIQQCGFSTVIANNLNQSQLGCRNLLTYLGLPSDNKHNGGNDAVFEMQGWLAGLCLTAEQRSTLNAGYVVGPVLPKSWTEGISWSGHLCGEDASEGTSLATSQITAASTSAVPDGVPALATAIPTASKINMATSPMETFDGTVSPEQTVSVGKSTGDKKQATRVAKGRKKKWLALEL